MGECVFDTPSVKVYVRYGDYPFSVYVNGECERAFRFQDEAVAYAEERARIIGDYEQREWDICMNCGAELINGYCPDCGAIWHRSMKEMNMRKRSNEYTLDVIEARLQAYLESLDDDSLAEIWNQYCKDNNYYDDMLLPNDEDEFNMGIGDKTPWDVATTVDLRGWDEDDRYLRFDIYGDPESFNSAADVVDFYGLVSEIIRNDDDFGDSDIRDILDETEDDREASRKHARIVRKRRMGRAQKRSQYSDVQGSWAGKSMEEKFELAKAFIIEMSYSTGSYGRLRSALEDEGWEPLRELVEQLDPNDALDIVFAIEG